MSDESLPPPMIAGAPMPGGSMAEIADIARGSPGLSDGRSKVSKRLKEITRDLETEYDVTVPGVRRRLRRLAHLELMRELATETYGLDARAARREIRGAERSIARLEMELKRLGVQRVVIEEVRGPASGVELMARHEAEQARRGARHDGAVAGVGEILGGAAPNSAAGRGGGRA